MQASMSRRGNCFDNAPMESFWGSLKNELVHNCRYATRAEAEASIREFIEIFSLLSGIVKSKTVKTIMITKENGHERQSST
jgi:hypothetical protein